ncbi:hypothetical protein G4B88_028659 [Cannabis sativa]|uniref:Cupin type-1 domain-containing protein n=2 Tax=Cannabis sativa TaxID=3483 RepID=A0A7J6EB20_CANSA|nr:hypothetical protein G4B88_028659 [Cannabis sativa]
MEKTSKSSCKLINKYSNMKGIHFLLSLTVLALAAFIASASDPSPLQDFCVAVDEPHKALFVNGKFCKDPKLAKAEDFFFSGLNVPRDTHNPVGSNVTQLNVDKIPGLNTLGISLARIDYAPYGQNPPHTHPRGSEILVVAKGTLYVGFVSSNQDGNRLFTKVLKEGDVFVFPIGLIHFQFNPTHAPAVAFAGLSSQNAGTITIANSVFGSNPAINPHVLAKAFQVDKNVIDQLQKQFCCKLINKYSNMKGIHFLLSLTVLALAAFIASASDPSPLQDFCVAVDEPHKALFVNGKFCKDPKLAKAEDFFFSGLNVPRDTHNPVGSNVTQLNVDKIPGLNTLGISLARIDYAPYGQNPPHTHPRGSEILVVAKGTLYVGFVSSNQDGNRLFTKVLKEGDVFVFPIGLIHFQFNPTHAPAVAFAGLSSQNAGTITIANSVFGSNPAINPHVLAKAFQVDKNVIDQLQKQFWYGNDN